jgi:hypothetical protein
MSSATPKVLIKSVTIVPGMQDAVQANQRSSTGMTVTLDMIIREENDSAGQSKLLSQKDLLKNVDIYVLQTTDPSISEMIRNRIYYPKTRMSAIHSGALSVSEALGQGMASQIASGGLRYEAINLMEAKYFAAENASGDSVFAGMQYEIPYQISFSVPDENLQHLEYRVFTHIDVNRVKEEYGIPIVDMRDILELSGLGGEVSYEPVIQDGLVKDFSIMQVDDAGVPWSGPTHTMPPSSRKMKGATHGEYQGENPWLTARRVQNIKINDLRAMTLPPVSERYYGGEDYYDKSEEANIERERKKAFARSAYMDVNSVVESHRSTMERIKKSIIDLRSSPTWDASGDPNGTKFRGDITLSHSPTGDCKLCFTLDWAQIVKAQSRFGVFFEDMSGEQLHQVLSRTKIASLKLWRRRMSESPTGISKLGAPDYVEFDTNDMHQLVAAGSDSGRPGLSGEFRSNNYSQSIASGDIAEVRLVLEGAGNQSSYRTFVGSDRSFRSLHHGKYQYYVEIDVEDGLAALMAQHSEEMKSSCKDMEQLVSLASIPAASIDPLDYRDRDLRRLDRENFESTSAYNSKGSYDFETNRYTKEFIEGTSAKYQTKILRAVRRYVSATEILYGSNPASPTVGQQTASKILQMINPSTGGTIEALETFVALLKYTHSSYEAILAAKPGGLSTHPVSSVKSASLSGSRYKFFKYFSELYDPSEAPNFAANIFANNISYPSDTAGFPVVNLGARVEAEYSRFQQPAQDIMSDVKRSGIFLCPLSYSSNRKKILSETPLSSLLGSSSGNAVYEVEGSYGEKQETDMEYMRSIVASNSQASPGHAAKTVSLPFSNSGKSDIEKEKVYGASSAIESLGVSIRSKGLEDVTYINIVNRDAASEQLLGSVVSKALASSVTGSGENMKLKKGKKSPPPLSDDSVKLAGTLIKKLAEISLPPSSEASELNSIATMPSIAHILKNVEDPKIQTTSIERMPMQIRSALTAGNATPGVYSDGRLSDFVQGMTYSIEELIDTPKGMPGTALGAAYRALQSLPSKSPASYSRNKRYRLCRLTPYQDPSLGITENRIQRTTAINGQYFLVEDR